jgi:hypothetical protein
MRESGTRVFSPAGMTASLTPALALSYLRELSLDIRAAVVLDGAQQPIAGDRALSAHVRGLLASDAHGDREPAPGVRAVTTEDGTLLVARTSQNGAIAVLAGDFAILPLLGHDLLTAAQALAA